MPKTPLIPSPDRAFGSTLSRRTVTAAAWGAPVIVASVATPALAASRVGGALSLGGPYTLTSKQTMTITGSIVPISGSVPAGFSVTATVTAPFVVSSPVTVSGTSFSFQVTAPSPATSNGRIDVRSNLSSYTGASAVISSLAPGVADSSGMTLVPMATTWVHDADEDGVRWYTTSTGAVLNPAANTPLLDLRSSFNSRPLDNFGNKAFAAPTYTGGWPLLFSTGTFLSATSAILYNTAGTYPNSTAVKTTLGSTSGTGTWATTSSTPRGGAFLPYLDNAGKVVSNTYGYYLSIPVKLPRSTMVNVEVKQFLEGPNGSAIRIGFRFSIQQLS